MNRNQQISLQSHMLAYRDQLQKGSIQIAYRGLMDFMSVLKTRMKVVFPEAFISGSLYFGVMDMTYFSVIPQDLKERGLKIAVVFLHQEFRFEVWLSGANRQIQVETWKLLKERGYARYRLAIDPARGDSILEQTLTAEPNFDDPQALTALLEGGVADFIRAVQADLG